MRYLKEFNENSKLSIFQTPSEHIESVESDIKDLLIDLMDYNIEVEVDYNTLKDNFLIIELSGKELNSLKSIILDGVMKMVNYMEDFIIGKYTIGYCATYRFTEVKEILNSKLTHDILNFGNEELFIVFTR